MAPSSITMWAIALFLTSLHFSTFGVFAQNCYYPNGDRSTGTSREAPCPNDEGVCCPFNWQCMSNGLCYDPNADFYGRDSCTDQTWDSSSCPDICVHNYTAYGAEAILQCPNGDWCCDGNRSWNCCTRADTTFFSLPKPIAVASITTLPPLTATSSTAQKSDSSRPGSSFPSSSSPSSSSSSVSSQSSSTPGHDSTITKESVTTRRDGSVSTVSKVETTVTSIAPADATQSHSSSHSSTNIGMVVGLALGIPLLLILAGILIFFLYRRRRKDKQYTDEKRQNEPPIVANYCDMPPGTHAPEVEGYPVAPTRSRSGRKSELYGSETFPTSPAVSELSSETTPPLYSPAAKSSPMTQIQEEPQELWRGYIPFQPPNAGLPPQQGGREESLPASLRVGRPT